MLLVFSCQPQPNVDAEFFQQKAYPTEDLPSLTDTATVIQNITQLNRKGKQVDSLLILSDRLKGYEPAVALFYAEQAYDLATTENWDLQRAISLYQIALMKRKLQTWGGGIEDALVDAEMSRLLFDRLGRQDWLVLVYDLMGIIHFRQYEVDRPMKLDTARYYFEKALTNLETAGLRREDSIALVAEIQHDLGETYFRSDPDQAREFFEKSYENYALIGNGLGLARLRLSLGELFRVGRKYSQADSIFRNVRTYALAKSNKELLIDLYLSQSRLFLNQYRQNRTEALFDSLVSVLDKRLSLQKFEKYYSYQQYGLAYQSKAVSFALQYLKHKASDPASASIFFDQAYVYVDSALMFYKTAIEDAQRQGVISVMDNLTKNILTNCIDKMLEGKGDCQGIFEENISDYVGRSYKTVADLMTLNLTKANYRVREMERDENDRISARKRQSIILIGLVVFIIAGLVFLLFLQRAEQKKLKARMDALRAQINPHFMSNSLNAIENLVNRGENEAASKYLVHFSRLSRQILNSSRYSRVSLKEELQTLRHFLTIEQLRFRDKLQFEFLPAQDLPLEQILVPAMILQPYVENAILHGIKPKKEVGKVSIKVAREDKHLICIVEDDGIGREKSRTLKAKSAMKRQSHGMKITEERLKTVGRIKGAGVEMEDLYDERGNATGTRVIIRLPYKLKKEEG